MSTDGDDVDEGWDDDAGDAAPDAGGDASAANAVGPDGQPRRKRRRRRRGRGDRPQGEPQGGAPAPEQALQGDPYAQPQPPQQPRPEQPRAQQPRAPQPRAPQQPQPRPALRVNNDQKPEPRERRRRDRDRGRKPRDHEAAGPAVDLAEDDVQAQNDLRLRAEDAAAAPMPGSSVGGALQKSQKLPKLDDTELEDEAPAAPQEAWGTDDGSPAPVLHLKTDYPPVEDDPDPASLHAPFTGERLNEEVANVVGARFVPAGRISWFDAGELDLVPGERVLCDTDRGSRLGWIATVPARRVVRDRNLRRVIRRANAQDLAADSAADDNVKHSLRLAKDKASALRLPLKVFRVEVGGGKLIVYYTSDDRLDLRRFVADLQTATGLRPELRQLGVRDEAKAVGGIGSCGLTLCCTTWLPDFVPVSIKMAKDQGLVLSPTKVSGQCGRLKCCLVYEQAAYAELRKGLPKLGKRVIGARGEGRVVEVDVLRQRLRVSYGPGDTEVVPATEVKPLFPSGNQPPQAGLQARRERPPRPDRPQQPPDPSRDDDAGDGDDDDDLDDDFPPDPSRDPNAED